MNQMTLFDGYTVEKQKAAITGWDVEEEETAHYRADEVLVLVCTATVVGGSFAQNANGDWVRTNKLKAHQVRVADGVMKDEIVEFFNLAGDELPFQRPGARSSGQVGGQAVGQSGGNPQSTPSPASTPVQGAGATTAPDHTSNTSNTSNTSDDEAIVGDLDDEDTWTPPSAAQPGPGAPSDPALAAFLDEPRSA